MTMPDQIQITHRPRTMTTDSADRALSQPSPETSATGALTDIQLWELLPKRLEQNLLAMVQLAAPHHNLKPIDLLQDIAPDFVDYARAVLARWGRPATPPAPCIDLQGEDADKQLLEVFYCQMGCGLEVHPETLLRGIRGVRAFQFDSSSSRLAPADVQRIIEALDFCIGDSDRRANSGNHHRLRQRLKRMIATLPSPATSPAPVPGEGLSLADVDELCAEFGFHYDDDQGETLEILHDMITAAVARWGPPSAAAPEPGESLATPPAPEAPGEALAARPLIERLAQLRNQGFLGMRALANQAAVWLRENPPGQPVAIEPRGCPTPGACSCIGPTPSAPEPGDVAELLTNNGVFKGAHGIEGLLSADAFWEQQPYGTRLYYGDGNADYLHRDVLRSAVTLLQRLTSPACLVVDRLPEGFLDLLKSEPGRIEACTAGVSIEPLGDAAIEAIRAIPLPAPQAGEVEA